MLYENLFRFVIHDNHVFLYSYWNIMFVIAFEN